MFFGQYFVRIHHVPLFATPRYVLLNVQGCSSLRVQTKFQTHTKQRVKLQFYAF
jgi:hypothetical protein